MRQHKQFGGLWNRVGLAWRKWVHWYLYINSAIEYDAQWQLTKAAIEQSATKRAVYMAKIRWKYTAKQVVLLDESACNRKTSYRDHAWAIQGRWALQKAFFVHGCRWAFVYFLNSCMYLSHCHGGYSILPALSLDGILTVDIIEGSFTTARFARFIDGLLDHMNPFQGQTLSSSWTIVESINRMWLSAWSMNGQYFEHYIRQISN